MSRLTSGPAIRLFAVAAAVLAFSAPVRADTLPLYALGGGVTPLATGSVSVEHLSSTQAAITLSITNTNPACGKISGFGFCAPNTCLLGQVMTVTAFTAQCDPGSNANFGLLSGMPLSMALGDATDIGTWLGGVVGRVGQGLTFGESGTFVLQVVGVGLNELTAASLLNGGSSAAQLQLGLELDPKLPMITPVTCDPGCCPPACQPNGVPAPPSVVLAGLGLGSVLLARLRRVRVSGRT